MNNGKLNIIQKQILNLRYNGKADGFAMQKEVTDWYYRELFPEMQMLIDEMAPTGIHVRLDKLEINLGIKTAGDWKQTLRLQLVESLGKQLRSEIRYDGSTGENSVVKTAESFLLLLKHYLQKGFLPWWSSIKTKNEFDAALEEWLLSDDALKHAADIKAILPDRDVVHRVALFDDKNFDGLIKLLAGSDSLVQDLQKLKKDVTVISEPLPHAKRRNIHWLLKQIILENVTKAKHDLKILAIDFVNRSAGLFGGDLINTDTSSIRSEQLKEAIFAAGREENFFQKKRSSASGQKETTVKRSDDKKIFPQEQASTLSEKDMISKKDDEKNIEDRDKHSLKDNNFGKTESSLIKKNDINDRGQNKYDVSVDLKEGIFIHNAGLVIVAGFLHMFFKKLSLLTEGNEITDKSKAAMLVQYLASGKESIAEFELGLAKILCGLEMQTPVDTTILLTTKEKEEANELLLSVIEYWSVLKNTSVDGLQDSFLLREGKLSLNDKGWLLQVEQKSFDMLLQQLPWNISMIKLPWMKNLLKTEWV